MNFNPLTVDDYYTLKDYFKKQPHQLSIYSLFSIIVWSNPNLKAFFAIEDDTLIILNETGNRSEDGRHLILPLSRNNIVTPEYLYKLSEKTGITRYFFVPETFLMKYDPNQMERFFTVFEQPEFEDYIYLKDDLDQLKGNRYAKQRNQIHQFNKIYVSHGRVNVDFINPDNVDDCMVFLQKWCDQRNCDLDQDESLACEKMATINALQNLDRLEAQGILIRIDGDVSAFGISSYLTEDMGVLNFEKAFSSIKGLYQYLDNECARRLFRRYKYINKESDMNLPNLAQSKNSYNPIRKLKSYCLTVR
jgi:hypothetical protein